MALIGGHSAAVTIPSDAGAQTTQFNKWTASIDREVFDVTSFDDNNNARVKLGGSMHLTGTCEGWVVAATTPVLGTMDDEDGAVTASFKLTIDETATAKEYLFSGIISNMTIVCERHGFALITVNFESSGAVTLT